MPELAAPVLDRPAADWHLRRTIGPRGILLALVVVIGLIWSGQRVELDRAAVEIGQAAAATVGLREESALTSGMANFVGGMFPLAIGEVTELSRLRDFDADNLPWFSYVEQRVSSEEILDDATFAWTTVERTTEVLVEPLGYVFRVARLMLVTIEMAMWATLIALALSAPLAFFGAANLSPSGKIQAAARSISGFLRAMPELIIAMILVLGFGFGPVAGILALALHTAGFFGKFFADDMENADPGPQEALRATGAGRLSILRLAILPQVLPQFATYVQYILERNVRTATIIGIVGAGGIGVELKGRWDMFAYQHVATILVAIFLTVLVLEQVVGRLRRRLI